MRCNIKNFFKKRYYRIYQKHEPRIITKFLLFPLCINGECRLFETVKIKQTYWRYITVMGYDVDDCDDAIEYGWKNDAFI